MFTVDHTRERVETSHNDDHRFIAHENDFAFSGSMIRGTRAILFPRDRYRFWKKNRLPATEVRVFLTFFIFNFSFIYMYIYKYTQSGL